MAKILVIAAGVIFLLYTVTNVLRNLTGKPAPKKRRYFSLSPVDQYFMKVLAAVLFLGLLAYLSQP